MIRSRLFKEPFEDCFDAVQERFHELCNRGHYQEVTYNDGGKTDSSPLIIATEARGYKIQEYNDAILTSTSAGPPGSSPGVISRSDRHGMFRPPIVKNPKLINSQ